MARRKKLSLYVIFIDFSQAYDMVPKEILFRVLQRIGCETVMLGAIAAMYHLTCFGNNVGCTSGITYVMYIVH